MPDGRLDRTRRNYDTGWRRPSENAAEQLTRQAGFTANVIEAEEFDTDCDPGDENQPMRRLRRRSA